MTQRKRKTQRSFDRLRLTKNKERMRYAEFRAQGLFVGSGVIEAGCKTVIGTRLKQSGMEWSTALAMTSRTTQELVGEEQRRLNARGPLSG